jgi:hypothetical protein
VAGVPGGRAMIDQHAEAFCLMKYAARDGSEVEWLWNSRDGVTPFGIMNRARTQELFHTEWGLDRRVPFYQPLSSERIFVDLTPERAEHFARKRIERYWDDVEYPMSRTFESQEQALAELVKGMLQPGAPDVIEARDWRRS